MTSHILVIGQVPPPVHGSNVMTERFLAAINTEGFSSEIVEKTFSRSMEQVGRASIRKLFKVPDLYRRIAAAVHRRRPDLCVYFISVGLSSLMIDCLALWLLRRKGVPYLLYFHGRGYRRYESLRFLPVRWIIRSSLRNASGGLVLGERLKEDVMHCIAAEKLYVVPNGIPDRPDPGTGDDVERERVCRVVFLSNLVPSKGPLRFLRMAKLVLERTSNVCFILAGRHTSTSYMNELRSFITRNNLEGHVQLTGPVYGPEKEKLFNAMDILVFPTTFAKETFGIVNIEAMQCGVPVVSSPVGAIPDIVRDGVNGYIVDPDDCEALADRVVCLVNDPGLRVSMGKAGRTLYEQHYSLDAYYRNTRRALEFFLARVVPLPGSAMADEPQSPDRVT